MELPPPGAPGPARASAADTVGASWSEAITIRGARQHNLKNLTLEIPKGRLTGISGVSGSGKSSLAYDTLYAEGQRCYVESLSTYARQFLERLEKPDVDAIDGIQPAIAIRQRNTVKSSRSTVGTATEIYDYLRLLFSRVGEVVCLDCGTLVQPDTPDAAAATALRRWPAGARLLVTFPARPTATLQGEELARRLMAQGYLRAWLDGAVVLMEEEHARLARRDVLEVVADRIVLEDAARLRLAEGVEAALRAGGGSAALIELGSGERVALSDRMTCARCGRAWEAPTAQLLSFNSPQGACAACNGFGEKLEFDEQRIVRDLDRTLATGAVRPWASEAFRTEFQRLTAACRRRAIPLEAAWRKLPRRQQLFVLEAVEIDFTGVIPWLASMRSHPAKEGHRFYARRYMARTRCRACEGTRLRPEARAVRVQGHEIGAIAELPIPQALAALEALTLTPSQLVTAGDVLHELLARLRFMMGMGLGYLMLGRASRTLSGGEMQRIHLSNALSSRLVETLYVLDEPSIGLHPADTHRLIRSLRELADLGNTVVVVEHDMDVLRACDHLIDLGPEPGARGGHILYAGPPPTAAATTSAGTTTSAAAATGAGATPGETESASAAARPASFTCAYLTGARSVPRRAQRRTPGRGRLTLVRARRHNLKSIDATFPLGLFVCVTGVSGSGKSTLVTELLHAALTGQISGGVGALHGFDALRGAENVAQTVLVDQTPIGRSARSNPVTYLQVLSAIRELLAATAEARKRGWTAGRFSFNVAGGRCPTCQGMGEVVVEMHFMADITMPCEDCRGRRFEPSTLEVRYRGRNIAEILDLTVDEAINFFGDVPAIGSKLWLLQRVGLGYLKLGQPAGTLSGGESQRIKIARELLGGRKGHTLYVLDEPTTGLHPEDIRKLIQVLDDLVEEGHTVLVIEHNLDVIKNADYVLDLGPGGGPEGGEIVVAGPPESLLENERSVTGRYLRAALGNGDGRVGTAGDGTAGDGIAGDGTASDRSTSAETAGDGSAA